MNKPGKKRAPVEETSSSQLKRELWQAVELGEITVVKRIVQQEPCLINAKNSHHDTVLSQAVKAGHLEMVKLLLAHGAELQWAIHDQPSDLLGTASFFGQREVGNYLISIGLEPSVLHAAGLNDLKLLTRLLEEDPGAIAIEDERIQDRPIHIAARAGSCDTVKFLVSIGEDINRRNRRGQTPLFLVAECIHADKCLQCAEYLLNNGADPSIRSEYPGSTALEYARKRKKKAIVQLIERSQEHSQPH